MFDPSAFVRSIVVALILCIAGPVLAAEVQEVQEVLAFQEADGRVVMEVESTPPVEDWQAQKQMEGFTGACYYTWTGPDLFRQPGKGVLKYVFNISEAGNYLLLIRNRHDHPDSTLANDAWTRMDNGKWIKTYSPKRGVWTYDTRHEFSHDEKKPAAYELEAGVHVLEISGRSKDFSIDRIVLIRKRLPEAELDRLPVSQRTPVPATKPAPESSDAH